ncbi:ATP-dependent DNA helicase RecG [Corynebacterium guangdongense]|uniref:ATP-dependent DNA helicase RecG n=1 Tax=Corynebacterium guangdongense TaxID=1783348 RepID=A0ABU1ZWB2_9CORY|nr:ATP-dependent DNA helicase RecG [Corynebacterium guangdongense]MDR7329219.1 ATP-dependent DNA helicase RecG [Corynebacterium guangdongense]WJZ17785.1 ATP-dependent DNA helicase RecG [Corynebacterium guangdongense]
MLGWRDERELAAVLPAKEAAAITKAFGYTRCWQLLEHYPRTYVRHGSAAHLIDARDGDVVTLYGTVVKQSTRPTRKRTKSGRPLMLTEVFIRDELTRIKATYFGSWYAEKQLTEGARAIFSGKIRHYQGQMQLSQPDFYLVASADGQPREGDLATGSLKKLAAYGELDTVLGNRAMLPVYPATAQVTSWQLMGAIDLVLETLPPIPEPLPAPPAGLPDFDSALRDVHDPKDQDAVDRGLARLKYNEALALALVMAVRRQDTEAQNAPPLPRVEGRQQDQLLRALPFPLTRGQQEVLSEISADISRAHPMSRLLQGEVGSGKTIVALLAMLQAVDNGRQCAMLAPTEVLTVQHARSLTRTLAAAGSTATVVALTGSMPTAVKREALLNIVSGQADIVVGTHALIQDAVEFFDLGLVVVDEQHRFGVEQRDRLRGQGRDGATPHTLVMTATPIPRTIAMTVFGDLAVSTLKELPGGRKPIQSAVVPEANPRWVERAWERIREEVAAGRQAYVVCPRIDDDGGVITVAAWLRATEFKDLHVSVLHGRMKGAEKDEVMADFAAGGIDVLVATTVIEVGVDVPNATVMMIRESENFGVSQLHQLRGRVGRGGHASLCLFHTTAEPGSPAAVRVQAVAETSDGFALADLDLSNRQEGDVLGTSQSGTHRTVKLLNLLTDLPVIEQANADAENLARRDRGLAERLTADIGEDDREFLDKT